MHGYMHHVEATGAVWLFVHKREIFSGFSLLYLHKGILAGRNGDIARVVVRGLFFSFSFFPDSNRLCVHVVYV